MPSGPDARPSLRAHEQRAIAEFVETRFGIQMPPSKKALLEGRLAKRLVACGAGSYGDYFDFITRNPAGRDEFLHFVDLVSTHETSFFREERHFDFLSRVVIPELCRDRGRKRLDVLCAACSSGEEAYSIGMRIGLDRDNGGLGRFDFSIEGFDLSPRMIEVARRGVYAATRVAKIPAGLAQPWLMRSKDPKRDLFRVVPELRARTLFHEGNLLSDLDLRGDVYDIVFCRNVLIYFNRANQKRALSALLAHLAPGGYLFLGHSESLGGSDLPARRIATGVFRKE